MKKMILITLAISLLAGNSYSASDDAGLAGPYLRNGIGARPMGMGGAYTAIAEGPEATYYNPAGMAYDLRLGVGLSYKSMSLDRHLSQAAISFPIRNEAAMAASWINAGVNDVTGRGSSRQIIGNISNNENAFTLSFAKAVDSSIALGGTLRYLQEKLDNLSSFAIGMDLGAKARVARMLLVGVAVQNIGSVLRWDSSKYWGDNGSSYDNKFPLVARLGLAGNLLSGRLIPAVDFEKSGSMNIRFRTGAEYWFVKTVTKLVPDEYEDDKYVEVKENVRWAGLRAGLDRGNPTFGASYAYRLKNTSIGLEYAFLVGQAGAGSSHIFTLRLGL